MPKFSAKSLDILATCHPHLQKLMKAVIAETDITILCGHRGEEAQNLAFKNHTSQIKWPNGKHNRMPSLAVDIAPYPIEWDNLQRFRDLAVIVKRIANDLDIPIEWGGDWGWKNGRQTGFVDLPHYQLIS